jgi:drug/metabolite transporter (DMT)-like permease
MLELVVPFLGDTVRGASPGTLGFVVTKVVMVFFIISLVLAWVFAVWDVATRQPWPLTPPRWLILVLLVVGHVITAVLYYFLVALWQNRRDGTVEDMPLSSPRSVR